MSVQKWEHKSLDCDDFDSGDDINDFHYKNYLLWGEHKVHIVYWMDQEEVTDWDEDDGPFEFDVDYINTELSWIQSNKEEIINMVTDVTYEKVIAKLAKNELSNTDVKNMLRPTDVIIKQFPVWSDEEQELVDYESVDILFYYTPDMYIVATFKERKLADAVVN